MSTQPDEREYRKTSFFDKIALFSAVVSLLCVLGAHAIDRMSRDGTLAAVVGVRPAPGLDYSGTATIGKPANATLNPCGDR